MSILRWHKIEGPRRWGLNIGPWFFGLVDFTSAPNPAQHNPINFSPMVGGGKCLCGADPMEMCKHPDGHCTSLNHPSIRKRIEADYG